MPDTKYATVDDMIKKLIVLSGNGYGDYTVVCNCEYNLALKGDSGEVNEKKKFVDFGGYIPR